MTRKVIVVSEAVTGTLMSVVMAVASLLVRV